jgi:hypothetical protein
LASYLVMLSVAKIILVCEYEYWELFEVIQAGNNQATRQKSEYYFLHKKFHMDFCRIFLLHAVLCMLQYAETVVCRIILCHQDTTRFGDAKQSVLYLSCPVCFLWCMYCTEQTILWSLAVNALLCPVLPNIWQNIVLLGSPMACTAWGKLKQWKKKKTAPVPLCPPQISYRLTRTRTR